nr:unnamed protein product [Digitaria exilis]
MTEGRGVWVMSTWWRDKQHANLINFIASFLAANYRLNFLSVPLLAQAIGSIEAIAKASKEFILGNTDLSTEKAERMVRLFRDPQYYLSPKIN